mmetsp:Transcript_67217/g.217222  ORF Transcript_67217/g.217222 Transcript_67217/m.217222 type:complete len:249 (-) Transcript_67217:51-797(-)
MRMSFSFIISKPEGFLAPSRPTHRACMSASKVVFRFFISSSRARAARSSKPWYSASSATSGAMPACFICSYSAATCWNRICASASLSIGMPGAGGGDGMLRPPGKPSGGGTGRPPPNDGGSEKFRLKPPGRPGGAPGGPSREGKPLGRPPSSDGKPLGSWGKPLGSDCMPPSNDGKTPGIPPNPGGISPGGGTVMPPKLGKVPGKAGGSTMPGAPGMSAGPSSPPSPAARLRPIATPGPPLGSCCRLS